MSDDYSMGSALDLAGRARELVESQNQAVDQSKSNVQQAQTRGSADQAAAKVRAQTAKIKAAQALIDQKMVSTERSFALTKTMMNFGFKLGGDIVQAVGDHQANKDRARAAVENGGAAMRRLENGGAHDQALTGMAPDKKEKAFKELNEGIADVQKGLKNRTLTPDQAQAQISGLRSKIDQMAGETGALDFAAQQQLNELRKQLAQTQLTNLNHMPGGANGQEAKALRTEIMNLDQQTEQLNQLKDFIPATKNVGTISVAVANPDALPGTDKHANMDGYLKQQGMNDRQIQAFKRISQLQSELNRSTNVTRRQNKQDELQTTSERLQARLDKVVQDQDAAKKMGPAAKYVDAMNRKEAAQNILKAEKEKGADGDQVKIAKAEKDISAASRDEFTAGHAFQKSREVPFNETAGFKLMTDTGEALKDVFQLLLQSSRQYANAQAQLSRASEEAGAAAKEAHDMELS